MIRVSVLVDIDETFTLDLTGTSASSERAVAAWLIERAAVVMAAAISDEPEQEDDQHGD